MSKTIFRCIRFRVVPGSPHLIAGPERSLQHFMCFPQGLSSSLLVTPSITKTLLAIHQSPLTRSWVQPAAIPLIPLGIHSPLCGSPTSGTRHLSFLRGLPCLVGSRLFLVFTLSGLCLPSYTPSWTTHRSSSLQSTCDPVEVSPTPFTPSCRFFRLFELHTTYVLFFVFPFFHSVVLSPTLHTGCYFFSLADFSLFTMPSRFSPRYAASVFPLRYALSISEELVFSSFHILSFRYRLALDFFKMCATLPSGSSPLPPFSDSSFLSKLRLFTSLRGVNQGDLHMTMKAPGPNLRAWLSITPSLPRPGGQLFEK